MQQAIEIVVVHPAEAVTLGLRGWYARTVIDGNVYSAVDADLWSAVAWMFADYYRREVEKKAPWMARPDRLPEYVPTGRQQGPDRELQDARQARALELQLEEPTAARARTERGQPGAGSAKAKRARAGRAPRTD